MGGPASRVDIAEAQKIVDAIAAKKREKAEAEKARWAFYKEQLAKMPERQAQPRKVGGTRGIKRWIGDL